MGDGITRGRASWGPARPGRFAAGLALGVLASLAAADGSDLFHSRPGGHGDVSFAVAPSGESVAFNAKGEGGRDLYLLDLATRRVTRVAATPEYEVDPEFAPDGRSLVYSAGRRGDKADHLFLRNLGDGATRQLTAEPFNDAAPAFAPDGSTIVFTRAKNYRWGGLASNWDEGGTLGTIRADGTGLREWPQAGPLAIAPRFAPDGRAILFEAEGGLRVMAADGAPPSRALASPAETSEQGTFAPDGKTIAFAAGKFSPSFRIYLARPDGTEPRSLPAPPPLNGERLSEGCFQPAFHPDGKRLLFFQEVWPAGATGEQKFALWEVDLATSRPSLIADYTLFDDPLGWKPPAPAPVPAP